MLGVPRAHERPLQKKVGVEAMQQAGWSISNGSWGSPGSSTVPAGPLTWGCLCPAEVTLAEANASIAPPKK